MMFLLLVTAWACDLDTVTEQMNTQFAAGEFLDAAASARERLGCLPDEELGSGWMDLATVLEQAGDTEQSLVAWTEASQRLPPGADRASAWLRVGLFQGSSGDRLGSVAPLEKAVAEAGPDWQQFDHRVWLAQTLGEVGEAERALAVLEEARPFATEPEQSDRITVATALIWRSRAMDLEQAGDPQGALEAAHQSYRAVAGLGPERAERAEAGLVYGQRLMLVGRFEQAKVLLTEVKDALATIAPGSLPHRLTLAGLAQIALSQGDAAASLEHARAHLALVGRSGPELGTAQRLLADALAALGRREDAAAMYTTGLANLQRSLGPRDPETLHMEERLAQFEAAGGKPTLALARVERILPLMVSRLGPTSVDTVAVAGLRCSLLHSVGRVAEALPCAVRAREVLAELLGDHPMVASAWVTEASLLEKAGAPIEAVVAYERALAMSGVAEVTEKERRATRVLLARALLRVGRRSEALEVLGKRPTKVDDTARAAWHLVQGEVLMQIDDRRALGHFRTAAELSPGFVTRSSAISAIAMVHLRQGRVEEAEAELARSMALLEEKLGSTHPSLGPLLLNLAVVYQSRGAMSETAAVLERHLALFEGLGVKGHPGWVMSLQTYGRLLVENGEHDRGQRHFDEALAMSLRVVGESHSLTAGVLEIRSNAHARAGNVEQALADAQRAVGIRVTMRPDHTDTLRAQGGLARALTDAGRPEEALALLRSIDGLVEEVLGDTPLRALMLGGMAEAAKLSGELEFAQSTAREALALHEGWIESALSGSERRRIQSVEMGRPLFSLVLDIETDPAVSYAAVLRWKGLAGSAFLGEQESDPALALVRTELAGLAFSPPPGMAPEERRAAMERLTAEKEALQTGRTRRERVRWQEVCRALGDDEALVDWVTGSRRTAEGTEPAASAFVLLGGRCDGVIRVALDAPALLAAHIRYRAVMASQGGDRLADRVGTALREVLWDPVELVLGGRTVVVHAVDAELANVSFAGLPKGDGYLVEGFQFRTVEHARDVLADHGDGVWDEAVVVGGVDYGVGDGSEVCGLDGFSALSGTLAEARSVAKGLERSGVKATLLTGDGAGEARVREAIATADVIHLATHGFHAGQGCRVEHAVLGSLGTEALMRGMNPMLLSGLALAGANDRAGRSGLDDGIWSAEEVASAELDAELVVLSACETGLGEVAPGEGVMGLRRGFKQAGVKRVVFSLWSVPDGPTRSLMEGFYAGLADGLGVPEALRRAQVGVLEANRAAGVGGRPTDWAAFVVGG